MSSARPQNRHTDPRVSVVIPTFRRAQMLERALNSVLAQSFSDFEIIVVDDNGRGHPQQQATAALLRERFDDPRVRYIVNEPGCSGASATRNVGIDAARGEFVAFLDDDEDWLPGKLERQVSALSAAGLDTGIIDTGFWDHKSNGRVRRARPKMQGWILEPLLQRTRGRIPKLSTLLCRRQALEQAGLFDTGLPAHEDYELYLRLARNYRFASIDAPLANKRADADGRLTGNPHNIVQGYAGVYEKHLDELQRRPRVHAIYLLRYAAALAAAGRRREAWHRYRQAYRLWRTNPRLLSYGLKLVSGKH